MGKYFNVYSLIKGKKNSYDISFISCRSEENTGGKLMIVDAAKQTSMKITREIEGFWTKCKPKVIPRPCTKIALKPCSLSNLEGTKLVF